MKIENILDRSVKRIEVKGEKWSFNSYSIRSMKNCTFSLLLNNPYVSYNLQFKIYKYIVHYYIFS